MDLPDKSNPQRPPEPPKKKVEQVVSGAVQVKRPAGRRILDYVFAESPKEIGAKIGRDIVVPRIKAGVEEALGSFLHGMLWGGGAAGKMPTGVISGQIMRPGGATQYHNITTLGAQAPNPSLKPVGTYQDLRLPSQQFAEILLANLYDLLNQYRLVSVADLYEAAGITPGTSDGNYGWTSLDGARISKERDGYRLELPRPSLIT